MRRLRVAILCHEDLVPPEDLGAPGRERQPFKTEDDVRAALRELGHEVRFVGVAGALGPIREAVDSWKPHVVFNLLMEFQDVAAFQVHVASYLELLNVPYTGCNPSGILLTREKVTCKKILRFHRIPTPRFAAFRRGRQVRAPRGLAFPLIVKSASEEASLGISQASIVRSEEKLRERVAFVHEGIGTHAIAEEYKEGREITVSVLGNHRLEALPPWELFFRRLPEGSEPIATEKVKFDAAYQRRVGVESRPAKPMSPEVARRLAALARRTYRAFGLSGYARLDLRLDAAGAAHVIEVNATPDVARDEDLALSAERAGIGYAELIQRILGLGLRYRAPWKPGG